MNYIILPDEEKNNICIIFKRVLGKIDTDKIQVKLLLTYG